jgi:phosphate transport system permease protein
MATETGDRTEFGEVSRLKGVAFEYLSLGASFLGIVSLAVLLLYVAVDAFGLEAADPLWYLVYFLTFVVPTGVVAWYGLRNRAFGRVGAGVLFRLFAGLATGLAVAVLFIIFDLLAWFLVFTVGVLPAAGIFAYGRIREWPSANLLAPVVLVGGVALGIFLKGPVATFPQNWVIYLWTLGVPMAAVTGYRAADRGTRRDGAILAALTLAVGTAAAYVGPAITSLHADTSTLFALTLVVPTATYAWRAVRVRDEGAAGLVVPVVIVGGALLGAFVVQQLGIAQPASWFDWQFLTSAPSTLSPEEAGLFPAIVGSVFVITNVAILTLALGVGTAIYLEEYAPSSGLLGQFTRIVQVNISNLAGVPSVVYGLLGLGLFVNLLGFDIGIVLVASITLALLILPIVIISAQEAIRAVPNELRQASYGMGATKWQTVRNVVLPRSLPGILTGTILALGRAIGETAPLLMIGAATTTFSTPTGFFDSVSAMPLQIYAWSSQPGEAYRYGVVAAGVVTLLVVLLTMNSVAILIRNKYQNEA